MNDKCGISVEKNYDTTSEGVDMGRYEMFPISNVNAVEN